MGERLRSKWSDRPIAPFRVARSGGRKGHRLQTAIAFLNVPHAVERIPAMLAAVCAADLKSEPQNVALDELLERDLRPRSEGICGANLVLQPFDEGFEVFDTDGPDTHPA